ncbi:bifunctional hydroxymethylpyrimidine kinase/phosphomethylpyrimidine kinase [Thalassovita mediterranea]|jgi:hydroxymethylpyrimidine/phosphomethylpyrimidine kinase|uniref:hydroxymethylpyrimidine kinase n=1 Tax=Thalassovita mediterranea TaxID=340021 RepID=A0A0P1GPB9_9RHOB|nr:hydroxymethylpyrimidine/phosphomethylpyrimidine kinase [Thalassovita mediterranea]CUH84178.1 Hydroxymethylpyrimidine/phosphomethylpyrimidine kinase [Thalassovita mediterranea]SIS27601.1 hydroxymethylpyrimidine kinase /phosphomethylpyrimidine kinase [Thalassovita mediterranea]
MAVLMIGGIDSSGGAGVLRDCATAVAFGVGARVAVTAVTAQTDRAVLAAEMCSPTTLAAQINAAFAQGPVGAIKIGMLGTGAAVEEVAGALVERPEVPVVLDPVIASSSGKALIDEAGLDVLLDRLLPLTTLITPNLPEAAQLAARLGVAEDAVSQALMDRGAGAVLIKGGHGDGAEVVDHLITPQTAHRFAVPRQQGSLRGTGCALAAAIACGLSQNHTLPDACRAAQAHIQHRFAAARDQ